MSEKYTCRQEVPRNILDSQPEVEKIVTARNRANIAEKLIEIISDHDVHHIQLIESKEPIQQIVAFVAELFIYG